MLDAATLREELDVMIDHEGKLRPRANRAYAIKCIRGLRLLEDKERDDVPRSPVTGY